MAAAAHDPKFAKKAGIPVKVAKEYNQADKGPKLAAAMKRRCLSDVEGILHHIWVNPLGL